MNVEWEQAGAITNAKKRGVTFEEVRTVVYDRLAAPFDHPDHSRGERRFITMEYSARGRRIRTSNFSRPLGTPALSCSFLSRRATPLRISFRLFPVL